VPTGSSEIPPALDRLIYLTAPFVVLIAAYASGLMQWVYDRISGGSPGPLAGAVVALVMTYPAMGFHELGHAAMVRVRLPEAAVRIRLKALYGQVEYDAGRATLSDALWITLAGPVASLLGALAGFWLLPQLLPGSLFHVLVWGFTCGSMWGVLNLLPVRVTDGGRTFTSDGRVILGLLTRAWALR
jgi:hypothetical protein